MSSEERTAYFTRLLFRDGKIEVVRIPNPNEVELVFLNEASKRAELNRLGKYIHHAKTGEDFEGRDLKFDLELEPYVKAINKQPEVVTESSCIGHKDNSFAYISISFSKTCFYQLSEVLDVDIEEILRQGLRRPGRILGTNVPETNYSIDIDTRSRTKDGAVVFPVVVFRVLDKDWKEAFEDLISRLAELEPGEEY